MRKLDALVAAVVDATFHFRESWLNESGRIAVPVASGAHFARVQAELLSRVLRENAHPFCYAVASEPLRNMALHWRVPATVMGLLEFSSELGHFSFLLAPENGSFAILCTTGDYYLLGGPKEFVEAACGGDIAAAFKAFESYADQPHLREVYARYARFAGEHS